MFMFNSIYKSTLFYLLLQSVYKYLHHAEW